jgi:alkylation response protein AidB-like acyl-CoA dehydrogenase
MLRVVPAALSPAELALRAEVRAFLTETLPHGSYEPGLGMFGGFSPEFSRALGARGWLGMAIPSEYGGHGRGAFDRFVVVEELLAAGAPVGAHWVADRQSAPAILKYGTDDQRHQFLPAIAAGECYFAIGMSEPDAGSDLAAVRTGATRTDGGWLLNGTKVWTTLAHHCHYFFVLCRTSPAESDRHQGLSQLIVDLHAEGVQVNPIPFLDGTHDFNEVVLTDIFVPDEMVLGELGQGWRQVTSELAFERSGPDRYLTMLPVLRAYFDERLAPGDLDDAARRLADETIGHLCARLWSIRQLSMSVARALDAGQAPVTEAALVKDLGTILEQDMASALQALADADPDPESSSRFERLLARAVLSAPAVTLRGGTTEILRGIVGRALRSTT